MCVCVCVHVFVYVYVVFELIWEGPDHHCMGEISACFEHGSHGGSDKVVGCVYILNICTRVSSCYPCLTLNIGIPKTPLILSQSRNTQRIA